jgi:hypothetical protein
MVVQDDICHGDFNFCEHTIFVLIPNAGAQIVCRTVDQSSLLLVGFLYQSNLCG